MAKINKDKSYKIQLKAICDLQNGYAFKSSDYVESSNTLNCRMSNIRPDGSFDILYNSKYLPDEFAEKCKDYLLYDGDLIIAMTDMAGDPKILGVPTVVKTQGYKLLLNQRVGKLILNNKNIHIPYLKLSLQSQMVRKYFKKFAGGGLQLNVGKEDILNATIVMYPEEIQKNIADEFEKLTQIINKNKLILDKYDLLIKSRFIEMFGDNPVENGKWKVEKLGNLVTVTSSKRIYAEEQSTEGIPFLRISDLVSKINGIDSNDLYIPEEKYHEFVENGLVPNADDILVTSRGTLGLCYTITADDKFYFQDGMITWLKFSNHESILSIFLSYLFTVILKQKIDLKTNGATVKYVSISELKNLEIPVPPIELQQQFASFVQQIDKSKFVVQKSLEKAETLYKSLMQEYFG